MNLIKVDLCLRNSAYDLTVERKNAQDENQGLGALAGAAWGASKGGLGGALLGALGGAMLGGLFGEPLHELKQRMLDKLQQKLIEIDNVIVDSLNKEITKIHQNFIKCVIDNYRKNQQNAVKLLMSGKDSQNSQPSSNEKENIPVLELNLAGIMTSSISIFLILVVIFLSITA